MRLCAKRERLPKVCSMSHSIETASPSLAHTASQNSPSQPHYIIYALRERVSGQHYVGLTMRSLPQRISAHLSQARRNKSVRDGGLMAALRRMDERGQFFDQAFESLVVAHAAGAEGARTLECHWIAKLNARQPHGYNSMPGGSSVGGRDNAKTVTIVLPDGVSRTYASIQDAIIERNRDLQLAGKPSLEPGTVYARFAQGWPAEEALGYQPHVDGRTRRPEFRLHGQTFSSLSAAAAATGIKLKALRSRLHRLRQRSDAEALDISLDRRSCRSGTTDLSIPWPRTGERLTAEQFAARTGVPKATVMHRWHRTLTQTAHDAAPLSPEQLFERLTSDVDRRKLVRLDLPDGRVWMGGEREIIRRVLDDTALEASRACRLSTSGIRRRLRQLTPEERRDSVRIAAAFGFIDAGA